MVEPEDEIERKSGLELWLELLPELATGSGSLTVFDSEDEVVTEAD